MILAFLTCWFLSFPVNLAGATQPRPSTPPSNW